MRRRGLLVTGAGGQVGGALGSLVPDAVLLDRAALDVTDPSAVAGVVAGHAPEVVVHAAAWTKVDAAESDPTAAHVLNVDATRYVAQAAARAGALMVLVSTDYVFPGDGKVPYTEVDRPDPRSVYGRTKLAAEGEAAAFGRHLVVRTSWVFGDGHNFVRSILGAAASRTEVTVVDDQHGLPTYAVDFAGGLLALVDAGAEGVYHLAGGGEPASWADLAEVAIAAAGLQTKVRRMSTVEYLEGRPGPVAPRPAWSVLDCSKAASLGVALRPWRDAVAAYAAADPHA